MSVIFVLCVCTVRIECVVCRRRQPCERALVAWLLSVAGGAEGARGRGRWRRASTARAWS
jgi:hypothetical protein